MKRRGFLAALIGAAATLCGQPAPPAVRWVEVRGTITRFRLSGPGPCLELKDGARTYRVLLGSMRYLMEQNFNPKTGTTAIVRCFWRDGACVAGRVEIPSAGVRLQLRDQDGRPVWRRRWASPAPTPPRE